MIDRYPGLGRSRAGKFLLTMADCIEGGELETENEVELEQIVQRITEYLSEKVGKHDLSDVLHTVEHTLELQARRGQGSDRGCDPYYWG